VALPKIGWNEGSLLRRTLLHVGTFLVGSAAFIGIVSFVLVTIAKGLVAPKEATTDDEPEPAATAAATPRAARTPRTRVRNRRTTAAAAAAAAAAATAKPAKDE
jgi:hypothetical protein